MHRFRLLVLLSGVLSMANLCHAQTATGETLVLNLPRQSQHAQITQRIGITDITINYHRPLANGRQIWGKVVPYGEVCAPGPTKTPPSHLVIRSPSKASRSTKEPTACT